MLREAIAAGLDNRAEALEYALEFGRGIDAAVADRFVAMYVNELTADYGDEGRTGGAELLAAARRSAPSRSPSRSTSWTESQWQVGSRCARATGSAHADPFHAKIPEGVRFAAAAP